VLYGGGGGGAIHGFGWSGRRRWDSGVEKRCDYHRFVVCQWGLSCWGCVDPIVFFWRER
jgi:hypothetical protein